MANPFHGRARRIVSALLVGAILAFLLWMLAGLYPLLRSISAYQQDEHPMIAAIEAYGAYGVLILAALQAIQVVTVFFPAVAIQILGGLVYGIVGGVLVCLAGYLLGNLMIYLLVRELHVSFSRRRPRESADAPSEPRRKRSWDFSFLRTSKRATRVAVILFLIPGVPNAILSYLLASTRISLPKFLLCCLAGTPTIVLAATVGQQLGQGDVAVAVAVFSVLGVASLLVVLAREPLLAFARRLAQRRRDARAEATADLPTEE